MEDIQTANLAARSAGVPSPLAHKPKVRGAAKVSDSLLHVPIPRETARSSNHRTEDRYLGLIGSASLRYFYDEHEVEVINLSPGGAMVASPLKPRIGERVEICFDGDRHFQCHVRWVRNGRIGLEFTRDDLLLGREEAQRFVMTLRQAHLNGGAGARDQHERPCRHAFLRSGALQTGGDIVPVRVKNVSRRGAMIETECELTPGSGVRLDLSGAGFILAEVRWVEKGCAGVRFDHDIELEPLFSKAEMPRAESPQMLVPDYLKNETSPNSPWAGRWATLSATELKPVVR